VAGGNGPAGLLGLYSRSGGRRLGVGIGVEGGFCLAEGVGRALVLKRTTRTGCGTFFRLIPAAASRRPSRRSCDRVCK
jgi:hypothetical protein